MTEESRSPDPAPGSAEGHSEEVFRLAEPEEPPPALIVRRISRQLPPPQAPQSESSEQFSVTSLLLVIALCAGTFAIGRHLEVRAYAYLIGLITLGGLVLLQFLPSGSTTSRLVVWTMLANYLFAIGRVFWG